MAQINPYDIEYSTHCYAAVSEGGFGFIYGRLHNWRLTDLKNPTVQRTLNQDPDKVLAAFETREELELWLSEMHKGPAPKKNDGSTLFDIVPAAGEVRLNTVGSGRDKLVISQIL